MNLRILFYDRISGNFMAGFFGFLFCCLSVYINDDYGVWEGPWPIIIGVTITTIWVTRLHALQESIRIKNFRYTGKLINHKDRFIQRIFVALIISSIAHLYVEGFTWQGFVFVLACTFYIGSVFWLIFDSILSDDRGLPIFTISNWHKTAWLDKLFHGEPVLWLTSKIVLFVVALWTYLKVFQG